MSLSKALLLAVSIFFMLSCSQKFQVNYPDNMPDEITRYVNNHDYTVIVYHEVTGCTGCSVSELKPWGIYKKSLDKYKTGVLFVMRSRSTEEENIRELLQANEIEYPCIFDRDGSFKKTNSVYEHEDTKENVIVVNKYKNVIFTESPIKDEESWRRFVKHIKK